MHKYISLRACRNFSTISIPNPTSKSQLTNVNQHLISLSKSGRINEARKLFDEMPNRDQFACNTMIETYANSGNLTEARKIFYETPKKNAISWSSLVSGYCKTGCEYESFRLLYEMQHAGFKPNHSTLGSVLKLCSMKGFLSKGEQMHGYSMKTCYDKDLFVVTGLIDMYAKCLRITEAECLFESVVFRGRNHFTWTAMINGYSLNGDALGVIECFRGMRGEGVEGNQYTFPGVLAACGFLSDVEFGVQVHACVVNGGFGANVFVQSALVEMYTKCGELGSGWKVVESMERDDVVSWNIMIVGYARRGFPERALSLFKTMRSEKDMELDEFTYPSVLNALAWMKDVDNGKCLHALVIKSGFEGYLLLSNALIDMYAKQNKLDCAMKLFDFVMEKDVISWTSLITGLAQNGCHEEALKLFRKMRMDGMAPDHVVVSNVLSSCAELALLDLGQQIHADSTKAGIRSALSVGNSLVSLYTNCGSLGDAKKVFYSMETKNVISWTALIVGYARNGKGMESFQFYDEMTAAGIKPDFITFIGLLFACSHSGLVDRGRYYFDSMVKDYGISACPDHYACMIDLLGRSGRMQEAEKLLDEMTVEPDATVWKALLSACRVHGHIDLAERASTALIELEPHESVAYVMLSNMYSEIGKWDKAASVRRLMKKMGVGKEPGRSWIEMNSKVYIFTSEDRSHPEARDLYMKVDEMMNSIKLDGYVPDMRFALHDINEESKERGLAYHSEKLAVAFGLLKVPMGAPIRVYKNIRVCGDCHNAMKSVSRVYQRHIILRDSNCFHHFKEGVCSCGDYW